MNYCGKFASSSDPETTGSSAVGGVAHAGGSRVQQLAEVLRKLCVCHTVWSNVESIVGREHYLLKRCAQYCVELDDHVESSHSLIYSNFHEEESLDY